MVRQQYRLRRGSLFYQCLRVPMPHASVQAGYVEHVKILVPNLRALHYQKAAQTAVFAFIEMFYSRQRLHSSLGYRNPLVFEAAYYPETVSFSSSKRVKFRSPIMRGN